MNRSPRMLFYILIATLGSTWAQSSEQAERLIGAQEAPIVYSNASTDVTLDKNNTETFKNSQEPWLTVFVHGIKSVKPHISLDNFFRFMVDDIQDTVYAKNH